MSRFELMKAPIDDPKKNPRFFEYLPYPMLCSPKIDGIRAGKREDVPLMSRTWKPIPSYQAQDEFTGIQGLDGELIEGCMTDFDVYNRTQSHVMSKNKPGDLSYHIFDSIHPDHISMPFADRLRMAHTAIEGYEHQKYFKVEHETVNDYDSLIAYENKQLKLGFEGIMMRSPYGRYKNGRCTMLEQILYKLKRFSDDEAVVIGFVERMANLNELKTDELGYAKRSSAKDGKVPMGMVGKFIVKWKGLELEVAPGSFKHPELKYIWDNQALFLGKLLKFRYFAHGVKDMPRFPRALGWRDLIDL